MPQNLVVVVIRLRDFFFLSLFTDFFFYYYWFISVWLENHQNCKLLLLFVIFYINIKFVSKFSSIYFLNNNNNNVSSNNKKKCTLVDFGNRFILICGRLYSHSFWCRSSVSIQCIKFPLFFFLSVSFYLIFFLLFVFIFSNKMVNNQSFAFIMKIGVCVCCLYIGINFSCAEIQRQNPFI